MSVEDPARNEYLPRLGTTYEDAILNLSILMEMTQSYASGQFAVITAKKYGPVSG